MGGKPSMGRDVCSLSPGAERHESVIEKLRLIEDLPPPRTLAPGTLARFSAARPAPHGVQSRVMHVDVFVSTAMFAVFIWAVTFMLPRAIRSRDALAVSCGVLAALLSLVGWLLIGVGVVSTFRMP